MNQRQHLLPLFLALIPGLGHFYLRRFVRALLYSAGFFGPILIVALFVLQRAHFPADLFRFLAFVSLFSWGINMVDMILTLMLHRSPNQPAQLPISPSIQLNSEQQEKAHIMALSFIPGLGHYQLGLMHRGLTAMIAFFGSGIAILFISFSTHNSGFLAFLLALPIIWFYSLFDAIQQHNWKQAGLELTDHSLFEDFHEGFHGGKKNKSVATVLAVFPGAAHLYLGMQKRGIQLMAFFLLAVYILDVLRLSLFLFLIPLLWFFSFFDALQSISKQENGTLVDKPLIESWVRHQKKIGTLLILLGAYYVCENVVLSALQHFFRDSSITFWISQYAQTVLVSLLFIIGGIWLLSRHKREGN